MPYRIVGENERIPSAPGGEANVHSSAGRAAEQLLRCSGDSLHEALKASLNPARDRWLNTVGLEPWQCWLYAIREFWLSSAEQAQASAANIEAFEKLAKECGYLPGQSTPIGRRVWSLMVTKQNSLAQVMAEQGLSTGQELDRYEEPTEWIHDGTITYAFKTFAHFCGVLAARRACEIDKVVPTKEQSTSQGHVPTMKPVREKQTPASKVPPPPPRLGGLSIPDPPAISMPRISIEYPEGFSEAAKTRVFRAHLDAGDAFDSKRGSIHSTEDLETAVLKFMLQVFGAFTEEASDVARVGTWTAERYELICLVCLQRCAGDVRLARGGGIPIKLQNVIERSDEWRRFRGLLRQLTDAEEVPSKQRVKRHKLGDHGLKTSEGTTAERAARRQTVVMPILANKRWKMGRLATEAGVGKNSIYDYLNGRRGKITDDNRKAIAEALGVEPESLPD